MELNQKETACVARHLIAQHRQAVYKKVSFLGEPCSECPYLNDCLKSEEYKACGDMLWNTLYPRICNEAGWKISFALKGFPLVPYDTGGSMIHINGIEYDHIAITNSEDELLGMITSEGEVVENDGIKILFAEKE